MTGGRLRGVAREAPGTAVLGASDGLMSVLGVVVFIASRSPSLVFAAAVMAAVSAAYSMGAGQFLAQRGADWRAVPVMAAATFGGTVLPAVPYLWSGGHAALAQSAAACLLTALAVGRLRTWRRHRYAETVAVTGMGVALTVACNLLAGGGTA
ncbi:MAG: VIT1/CCC1 transporter family protein [Trebonia sp.]